MEKKGGILTLRGKSLNGMLQMEISDSGIGIGQDLLRRIFEPFFTTKGSIGSGNFAGSGLGLSVSYGIIQELKGDISVTSTPGVGTTFLITVPVGAASSEPASAPEIRSKKAPVNKHAAVRRILIIDDEPTIRDLLASVLARDGHDVQVAPNGFAGIEKARHFKPEIAIIDEQMPGMSGKDTLAGLRREHTALDTLMITGQVGAKFDAFSSEMSRQGIKVIQKPFDIIEIREAVQRLSGKPRYSESAKSDKKS
jgi:two-component system, cell cycle sensor histidine kinase and response regulator CckA